MVTMNKNDINGIVRDMSVMAFYRRNHMYEIAMFSWESIRDRIEGYIASWREDYLGQTDTQIINQFEQDYHQFIDDINHISIPQTDFETYLRKMTVTPEIEHYFDVKKSFEYATLSLTLSSRDNYPYMGHVTDNTIDNDASNDDKKTKVLNKNNPFADITIENQSFLYPDANGVFQTLNFNVGHTISQIENENSAALIMSPDFKISKSKSRQSITNTISMDDSITSPIPETSGSDELLYI